MTDRELLELAAKAAGICIRLSNGLDDDGCDDGKWTYTWRETSSGLVDWNPLTDDGDALRLAVKLGIDVHFRCTGTYTNTERLQEEFFEPNSPDLYSATRRAIVRAAAAIGKEKP